ncbi:MAG: hypothetical protein R3F46_13865 [bacterium]
MAKDDSVSNAGGAGLGWFWIGAGLGIVMSATAVVVASEFREGRRRRLRGQLGGFEQGESDLIEDLTTAVSGGLSALAETAELLSNTFSAARSELIKFNLDSSGAGSGAGSSAWYYGEEDESEQQSESRELPDIDYEQS